MKWRAGSVEFEPANKWVRRLALGCGHGADFLLGFDRLSELAGFGVGRGEGCKKSQVTVIGEIAGVLGERDSARARVEELKQEIIAGRIKVPSTR